MKYKTMMSVAFVTLLLVFGSFKAASAADGPSFRQQLMELVSLREAGMISDHEYRALKSRVLRVMMH